MQSSTHLAETPSLTEILPSLFLWRSGLTGPQHPVNSYIWCRPQGVVLIDPADDLTPQILEPLGRADVTDVFITHMQEEHAAGCLHFLHARVWVPAGDEYLCDGPEAYQALITSWPPPWDWAGRGNYQGHLAGARNERPCPAPIPIFTTLRDGEKSAGVTVLSTPGSGKNAVTLLAEIEGQRVAFCGDLIFGDGQLWNWFDSEWDYGQETGQRILRDSAARLRRAEAQLLCPAHGPIVYEPQVALAKLEKYLDTVLSEPVVCDPINLVEKDSPAHGWRELLPNLHQWRLGNCAVLVSKTGNALLVDDGLCCWAPLPERAAHHRQVINELKRSLGITRIEIVIATHFHGDHVENIPDLVTLEGVEVVTLDMVAEIMERPTEFNLSAMLPWYGTAYGRVYSDRKVPDNTRLKWHEYDLEIFHLAGQTYYHAGIATIVGETRVIFAGDALPGWHTPPEPVMCYNDNEPQHRGWAYSLDRMIERRPDLLVCGHGAAIRDPMPLLQSKQIAWHDRIEQFKILSAQADLRLFFDPFL